MRSPWPARFALGSGGFLPSETPQTLAQGDGRLSRTWTPRIAHFAAGGRFSLAMTSGYDEIQKRMQEDIDRRQAPRERAGVTSRTFGAVVSQPSRNVSTVSIGLPAVVPPSSRPDASVLEPLEIDAAARAAFREKEAARDLVMPGYAADDQLCYLEKRAVGPTAARQYLQAYEGFVRFAMLALGTWNVALGGVRAPQLLSANATPKEALQSVNREGMDALTTDYLDEPYLSGQAASATEKSKAALFHYHSYLMPIDLPRMLRPLRGFRRLALGASRYPLPKAVVAAMEALQLPPGTGLYQLRHGGASNDLLEKVRSWELVQARGRWLSGASVRRYAKTGVVRRYVAQVSDDVMHFGQKSVELIGEVLRGWRPAIPPPTAASSTTGPRGGVSPETAAERKMRLRRQARAALREKEKLGKTSSSATVTPAIKKEKLQANAQRQSKIDAKAVLKKPAAAVPIATHAKAKTKKSTTYSKVKKAMKKSH